jgi:Tol biopolymer transport system component
MIAFDSDLESNGMRGIWKMNIDGTNKTRIIYEPDIGEVRMPNWTKNQNILVVTRYIKDTGYDPEIALIDTNGFTLSVLTNDNNFDIIPVMAPDQKYVVFTSQHFNNIIYKLYSVDINGQSLQKLTSHGYSADFSPDGENVVFCNCSPSNGKLWILRMSNKSKKQLTF